MAEPQDLGQHLVIECKIIGVTFEGDLLQERSGERTIPGMVLGQLRPQQDVLHQREPAVREILPDRHAAAQRVSAQNPRPQDARIQVIGNHRDHRRDQFRGVLVVRMHHHDDIRAFFQRKCVTGLLICSVPSVDGMGVHLHTLQILGDRGSPIVAGVVDEDDEVHDALRHDFLIGPEQRLLGVVGRHHHNDFFVFKHPLRSLLGRGLNIENHGLQNKLESDQ